MRNVSEGAIVARVNRVLAKEGHKLCKARPAHEIELGRYYRVGLQSNSLIEKDADLEETARELGVLRGNEAIAAAA